uniref:Uncharacterized protein n=1 Tax=Parascaris equorum TaxID=6256 RepID=A0A914RVS7_PAREQ
MGYRPGCSGRGYRQGAGGSSFGGGIRTYVEVFRSSGEEMDNSFYTSRGIPPPMAGPIPLRGLSPASDPRYGYRDRYGGYGGRFGGPMRGGAGYPRPAPYDRPYYERDRYSRYEPEYDEFEYDAAAKVFMRVARVKQYVSRDSSPPAKPAVDPNGCLLWSVVIKAALPWRI